MPSAAGRSVSLFDIPDRWKRRRVVQQQEPDSIPGTPILQQQFSDLYMAVQIAWGGAFTSPATWVWSDVTTDVEAAGKVVMTLGSADETQTPGPAQCTFTLDNRTGAYSQGGQSPNYPNVVRGVPIRVLVTFNGVRYIRFQGYAVGFTPDWDSTGRYAVVHVVAAGAKRRLQQQKTPVSSPLTRAIPGAANLVAYWPCEDGKFATQLAGGTPGTPAMAINGTSNLASSTAFIGSATAPTLGTDVWSGPVPAYTDTGGGQVNFLINAPSGGMPDQSRLIALNTTGSIAYIEFRFAGTPSAGDYRLLGWPPGSGTPVFDTGTVQAGLNNFIGRVSIQWSTSGGNTTFSVYMLNQLWPAGPNSGQYSQVATGYSVGTVTAVTINPFAEMQGVVVGQVYVKNATSDFYELSVPLNAFVHEYAGTRLDRLSAEQNEPFTRLGGTYLKMGNQVVDTYINLMEQCASVNQGKLMDGLSAGLTYYSRINKQNKASIDLELVAGQIEHPVAPVDDDQLTINQFTTSVVNGSSASYSNMSGVLGANNIGDYVGSASLNMDNTNAGSCPNQAADYAAWQVHMGSTPTPVGTTYRWPVVDIAPHHHPELLASWLVSGIYSRVRLEQLATVRPQLNSQAVELLVEGWTETIDKFTWHVTMNLSRYDLWMIGQLSDPLGDDGQPYPLRLEPTGSVVQTGCGVGGSSITVAGPLWTTAANDFPIRIAISGNEYQVTAISGVSSPQTFTLDPTFTLQPVASGAAVTLGIASYLDVQELTN